MVRLEDTLKTMEKAHDFLVCIDSDGTVFDNMELKHKECFCPALIHVWGLQSVARYAREVWEFANLYSATRGYNRFRVLTVFFDLLEVRPEAKARGFRAPDLTALRAWMDQASGLSPAALAEYAKTHPDPCLDTALRWSDEVNEYVARISHGLSPFPYCREALEKLSGGAEVVVVSDAPHATILGEWTENDIARYTTVICGQEFGTKQACITAAMERGYAPDHVLMVGDAPRDGQAARDCGVLFQPIEPMGEDDSWRGLLEAGADRFFSGSFGGSYEDGLRAAFDRALSPAPPWESK